MSRGHVLSVCVSLMAVVFASYVRAAEDGLVAHWDFDQGKGDVLHGRTGNKNHGKIHGAQWVKCGKGYALKFDGKDDYVDCGQGPSLDITGPITLEAWVCPQAMPQGEPGILGKFFESYALTFYGSASCYWYISSGRNNCNTSLELGLWHHITATFDGTTMRLYVNARAAASRKSKFKIVDSGKNFLMGCIVGDPAAQDPAYRETAHFCGMIDSVKVYARVLSDQEISRHYMLEAREKVRSLLAPEWIDRIKLTPQFYFDAKEVVVEMDLRGVMPLPEGAELRAELWRAGAERALQSSEVEPSQNRKRAEAVFTQIEFAPGDYEIRVTLTEKAKRPVMEKLAFRYPPPPLEVPAPAVKVVGPLPEPLKPAAWTLELCGGGGFNMLIRGDAYPFSSTFSYPHGGENTLLASPKSGPNCEPSWKVATRKHGKKRYRVSARGSHYAIDRLVTLHADHVSVADTIQNLTEGDIGIIIDNYLETAGTKFAVSYLSGVKTMGSKGARNNPSVFAAKKGMGIGLVALDDATIVHAELYNRNGRAGIGDKMFGLGPKASYIVKWNVYPVRSDDYFDFLNAARDDLGLNGKTVEGGFMFMPASRAPREKRMAQLRKRMALLRPKYVCMGCLSRCADDKHISIEGIEFIDFPKEMALVKRTLADTRALYPGLYYGFHLAPSLYATNKPERYADSRVIKSDGKQAVYSTDRTYMENYFGPNLDKGWDWWIFYPTLDNSFGKAMLRSVDVMMDEMGATTLFGDNLMAHHGGDFTFDRWDGHTVDIDPKTKTITRKYASVHLLSQEFVIAYCKKVTSKGGAVICDGGPVTISFAQQAPVATYSEEGGGGPRCRNLHFAPQPVALGYPRSKPAPGLYRNIQATLDWGVLYYYYFGEIGRSTILSRMYPITIESLHSGVVKGKERLVTAGSGVYGWRDDGDLHFAYLSDGRGLLVPSAFLTTVDRSGVRTQITLKENEMAVLKKVPVTIQSRRPVNLIAQQYDAEAIQLVLNGNGNLRFQIRDGDFPIRPGAFHLVKTDIVKKVAAGKQGTLSISIALKGQVKIRIEPAQG